MEVPKNFKDLQKLGLQNTEQYIVAKVPFPPFFSPLTFTSSTLSTMFTEKLSLALVPCSYILCMIMKLAYRRKVARSKLDKK